ncbi:MAG: tRNA pseudouridine(55) synthase TruB [Pseudomonadota bacterium]
MGRRKKGLDTSGWVILDKPLEMTSTQAVGKIKWLFNANKAGHAGTLDPLATGLLPIALGEATKTVPFVMDGEKVYRFTVTFGCETNTDDAEGTVIQRSDHRPGTREIEDALPAFTGDILQVPPAFSAIKVQGERAYDIARAGEDVVLEPRPISIHALDLIDRPDADTLILEAECGKGTYVRALARDLARTLGTVAHVTALRRLSVGPFGEEDMISLAMIDDLRHKTPDFTELAFKGAFDDILLPIETALDDIPALAVDKKDAVRLKRGQSVLLRGRDAPLICDTVSVSSGGSLIALGEVYKGLLKPKRIFNLATDIPQVSTG